MRVSEIERQASEQVRREQAQEEEPDQEMLEKVQAYSEASGRPIPPDLQPRPRQGLRIGGRLYFTGKGSGSSAPMHSSAHPLMALMPLELTSTRRRKARAAALAS